MSEPMPALLQALAHYLHTLPGVPDACAQSVLARLYDDTVAQRSDRRSTVDVVCFVQSTLSTLSGDEHAKGNAITATLFGWLHQHHTLLPWRRPGFRTLPDALTARLAVSELLGPDGLYKDDEYRIGVLLQAPDTHYPWHQHAAEEWYGMLSGKALWGLENAAPALRDPGDCIHHPPWIAHYTETRTDPLLAIWVWCGDIDGRHYRLLEASTSPAPS